MKKKRISKNVSVARPRSNDQRGSNASDVKDNEITAVQIRRREEAKGKRKQLMKKKNRKRMETARDIRVKLYEEGREKNRECEMRSNSQRE